MNKIYNSDLKMENILITTGSQQNLDMAGKIFLNPGDVVLMELRPTLLPSSFQGVRMHVQGSPDR